MPKRVAYTETEIREAARDPPRLRAMLWRLAQDGRRMAGEARQRAKMMPSEKDSLTYRADRLEEFTRHMLAALEEVKNAPAEAGAVSEAVIRSEGTALLRIRKTT